MPLELQLAIIFASSVFMGVLSGVSGGGAGIIMFPVMLAVGLPPQIAVATMKMGGLGAAFGGLTAFRKTSHIRKDIVKVMAPIAVVIGVITPVIFQKMDSDLFEKILGVVMLLTIPLLFAKKSFKPSKHSHFIGYTLYAISLFLVALFSAGIGYLAIFIMLFFFGASKIQANATKRVVMAFQVPITFVGLLLAGFVSLPHGITILISSYIGTHLGTKIALKEGEQFISVAMAFVALLTGLYLLVS
jgi:uncharacterized membrane protein YfcA